MTCVGFLPKNSNGTFSYFYIKKDRNKGLELLIMVIYNWACSIFSTNELGG